MKAYVNEGCIGCTMCAGSCPDVFHMEDGVAVAVEDVPAGLEDDVLAAVDACPAGVIEAK